MLPGNVNGESRSSSAELAALIGSADFSGCAVTVVGYGNMGRHYLKALRALGVRRIRVCSRFTKGLEDVGNVPGVEIVTGGYEHLECRPEADEVGIVATPTASLVPAAERLARLGFHRLLIEKPVSLWSNEIGRLAAKLERQGVDAFCAYNRVAYPSFHEIRACVMEEGGITSCTYTFTEIIKPDWPQRFPREELARWGIANSLHVISMAHGLIGPPKSWVGHLAGSLPWHPTGAVFVGSGVSVRGIPFVYHADWGSTGRWSVEVHTRTSSYRLCPLESLFRKSAPMADWEPVPLATFAPEIKAGFLEQIATMLTEPAARVVLLPTLREVARLTRYAEDVFGYAD